MNKNSKKIEVAVFGATGLIGRELVEYLNQLSEFKKINLVLRSPLKIKDEKVKIHKIDLFEKSEIFNSIKTSKVVFITIGTTMSRVKGDKKIYKRIRIDDIKMSHS